MKHNARRGTANILARTFIVIVPLCWSFVLAAFAPRTMAHYENSWHFYGDGEHCCLSGRRYYKNKDFISEFTCGRLFYKTLTLDEGAGYLYVGAMDYVFRLNLSDIGRYKCEENSVHLEATDTMKCVNSGKTEEYECRNHIRVIENIGNDMLYVCGTNAHSPRDLIIYKNLKHLPRHIHYGRVGSGVGRCPGSPDSRVASTWVGDPHFALFSGTHVDSMLADRLFIRWDLKRGNTGYKRTARYNTKWLDAAEFISIQTIGDYVYALIRERSSCSHHQSRILRVCLNDQGSIRHPRDWATFTKATLNCNAPHYHRLESVYRIPGDNSRLYAVFTNGTNSFFGGSAICSFTMAAVAAAFSGRFSENSGNGDVRRPLPEDRVPEPRPGACVHNTTELSDGIVNFIRSHPLMYDEVKAEHGKPIFVQKDVKFTAFAVDSIKDTDRDDYYNVYYCGTNTGQIYKIVQWIRSNDTGSYLLDIWRVFRDDAVIAVSLSNVYRSLYIASESGVRQIKTDLVCGRQYESCFRCSRDPYCGWSINQGVCEPYRRGLFQDVVNASPKGCEGFVKPKQVFATYGQSVHFGSYYELPEVMRAADFVWSKRTLNGEEVTISRSDKFVLTMDQNLVILGLNSNDAGLFECRYGNRLVAAYNLTIDTDMCVQPLQNGSYHRIYLDWCREFLKYKEAMKTWQKRTNQQCQNQNWEGSSNEVLSQY